MTVTASRLPHAESGARQAIQVRGLHKSFGEQVVLNGIDLSIPQGSVFSLLGPNGAGKTTVVRILATLTPPDSGTVLVDGNDLATSPGAVRGSIGVTGQFSAVDGFLTAEENLLLMGDLWHLPKRECRSRAQELLELFGLTDTGKKPVMTFSGGMKRRLDLAMTLAGSPRIIFLDEPTTGLDPRSRRNMWELIERLVHDQAVTIFLTTQYLEEADRLADQIAVLDGGRIVAQGTGEQLKSQVPGGHVVLTFADTTTMDAAASRLGENVTRNPDTFTLNVPSDNSASSVRDLLARIEADTVTQFSLHSPDLDDVFLALTGQAGGEAKR
ncbi:ATP-binding cassette domain-containing protein [Kineosporia sp. J2-2]|uniref:ATP-binding cassette domain-containing protein n=1 Tax=Kineosporia corallincola TaxID=2835133 RepID=A0ABS5THN9_9ACTN|nr:ATP-binding cassette domain-containing protein [Kineosporia corallincola]MBT0770607.1 ATP-binding cassette domain-containing protein [Kineosporia corallincola]